MRKSLLLLVSLVAAFLILTMVPMSTVGQEIAQIRTQGTCIDHVVTVKGEGLGNSCWDVKIDIPGRIGSGGSFRSSFYYIEKAICWPEDEAEFSVKLDSREPVIDGAVKLRQGNDIIEKDFSILQSCPQPLPDYWVIIIAFAVVLVFGWSLAWWWKRK